MTDLEQLTAALTGLDAVQRCRAAEALSRLGIVARAAAVPLVQACEDEDPMVRCRAAAALEGLGAPLPADVEALAALVASRNADVGYWSATLLGRLGPEAAAAVPALTWALSGRLSLPVRERAAWALGQIGTAAKPALKTLRRTAASEDVRLARLSQEVIEKIGGLG